MSDLPSVGIAPEFEISKSDASEVERQNLWGTTSNLWILMKWQPEMGGEEVRRSRENVGCAGFAFRMKG
jgi:hypothetical protein